MIYNISCNCLFNVSLIIEIEVCTSEMRTDSSSQPGLQIRLKLTHVFHCDRTVTRNCDAVTHNYDKKIVVTRSYDTKIVTMRKYVTVFLHSRLQLNCKSSATASYYFMSLTTVDEQSSLTRTISVVLPYFLNIETHTHHTKSP